MRESLTFCTNSDLDTARLIVQTITRTALAPHESSYRGGDYFLGGSDLDGEIIVQRNEDLDERAVDLDAPTVVYIGPTARADEIVNTFALEGLQLVARTS